MGNLRFLIDFLPGFGHFFCKVTRAITKESLMRSATGKYNVAVNDLNVLRKIANNRTQLLYLI